MKIIAKTKIITLTTLTTLLFCIAGITISYIYQKKETKPVMILLSPSCEVSISNPFKLDPVKYDIYQIVHKNAHGDVSQLLERKGYIMIDDFTDLSQLEKALQDLIAKYQINHIDYLINTPYEELIYLAAQLREKFDIPTGMRPAQAEKFVFKDKMKAELQRLEVATIPFTKDISKGSTLFGDHLVLKPIDGDGSEGIYIVKDQVAFEKALSEIEAKKRTEKYIAEPFIKGQIYNVDGLVQDGKIILCNFIKGIGNNYDYYRKNQPWGIVTVVDPTVQKILLTLAHGVLKMGHRDGAFHIEVIKNEETGEFQVIEAAARASGSAYAAGMEKAFSFFYPSLIYDILLKNKVKIPEALQKSNKVIGALKVPLPIDIEVFKKRWTYIEDISSNAFGLQFKTFRGYLVWNKYANFTLQRKLPQRWMQIPVKTRFFNISFLLVADTQEELLTDMERIKKEFLLKPYEPDS